MIYNVPDTQFDTDLGGERLCERQNGPRETCVYELGGDIELLGFSVVQEPAVFLSRSEEVDTRGSGFRHENEIARV